MEDTVRGLHALSERPTTTEWQKGINRWCEAATAEMQKQALQLARIEERMLAPGKFSALAEQVAVQANKIEMLNRIVWGMVGAAGSGILVIALARIFK